MNSSEPSPSQQLCANCGFCCDGTLFAGAPVTIKDLAEELEAAGLKIHDLPNGARELSQPCSMLADGLCKAYACHPENCQTYRCLLLEKLDDGKIDPTEARQTIESIKVLRNRLQQLLAEQFPRFDGASLVDALSRIDETAKALSGEAAIKFRHAHGAFLIARAAFDLYIRRHIHDHGISAVESPAVLPQSPAT